MERAGAMRREVTPVVRVAAQIADRELARRGGGDGGIARNDAVARAAACGDRGAAPATRSAG
jgi:hypothetical protein